MLGGEVGRMRREAWAKDLHAGAKSDRKLAAALREVDTAEPKAAQVDALLRAFFVDDGAGDAKGTETRDIVTKAVGQRIPSLLIGLRREQNRLIDLRERRRGAMALERSGALFVVATAILSTYARMKAERGALDFDDLIARALALLTRSSAAWVLHKLDYGLDHLLLDEAQDASPPQWGILARLTAEFFAGAGARGSNRTVFAVGDEKQSIFGFRGAAPEMLAEMKRVFAKRHSDAQRPFADVLLSFSFRSSQTILDAVDMTFRSEAAWQGVTAPGEPPPQHVAIRRDLKSVVELWPLIAPVLRRTRGVLPCRSTNCQLRRPPGSAANRTATVINTAVALRQRLSIRALVNVKVYPREAT